MDSKRVTPTSNGRHQMGLTRRSLLQRSALLGLGAPLIGASVAACGTRQGAGTDSGATATQTVTMAINESPWLSAYEALAAHYQAQTGVEIVLRAFPPDNLQTKQLNAVQNSSAEFDIYTMFGTWYGSFFDAGFIESFNSIDSSFSLDEEVITYANLIKWDADSGYYSPDGDVYAVPANGNFQILYYRKDIYADLGLSVPKTYSDVIANGKAIMQADPDMYGYAIRGQKGSNGATVSFLPLLRGSGGDILTDPPKDWSVAFDSSTSQEAMNLYLDLASLGPEQPESVGQAELISLMQAGKLAQATMVSAAASNLQDPSKSTVVDKIGYAVVPGPDSGNPAPTALPALAGIPAHIDDDQKKLAYDFLTWTVSNEGQTKFAEEGGTPARKDLLASDLADEHAEYQAILDSAPIATQDVAYPFAPELLEVTERRINEIVAGISTPQEGLDKAAAEIEAVLSDAGYL